MAMDENKGHDGNVAAPVKHYEAHLELPQNHILIDLAGDDLSIVKDTCQAIMKGGCRFDTFGAGSILIYHPTVDGGKRALGWLNTLDLPAYLSNKNLIGRREMQAA